MGFQYDSSKAAHNYRLHGVRFGDAECVFSDPTAITIEDPDAKGEQRFVGIGEGCAGNVLVVVYAWRGEDVRLISARRASRREREQYARGIRFLSG
jgi:uncharacterized DUF497 family protein